MTAKRTRSGGDGTTGTLVATVLGSSLAFIDGSVTNVALPAIEQDLHVDAQGVQWVINAYLLPLAALVLLGGALSDRLGRKRIFLIGIAVFTLASLGSMVAFDADMLHLTRAVQGLGAALFVPSSLAILGADFEGERRAKAIGTWAAASAIAGALGPILGGALVDTIGWRAIFAMFLPLGAGAVALGWKFIPANHAGNAKARVDWGGAGLATVSLGAITWGLTLMSNGERSASFALFGAGLAVFLGFLLWEKRQGDAAMMPLMLFGQRTFLGVTVLTLLLYAALAAVLMLVPYLMIARGWKASLAGASLLPGSILMGAGSTYAGKLAARIGARPMLTLAPLVLACGFAWLGRLPDNSLNYWIDLFPAMIGIGLGLTIGVAPLTNTVMSSVGEEHAGAASGVNNATARVGGMIATALLGLALADGGKTVPTPAFHNAAWVSVAAALVSAMAAFLLMEKVKPKA